MIPKIMRFFPWENASVGGKIQVRELAQVEINF
jgi:hypothetical protein